MEIKGKAAIVTGGGTGVGRATCLRLARGGCGVIVNYSRSRDAAEEVAEECRSLGVDAAAERADVATDADCRSLAEAARMRFGRLDVLVNNAGITAFVPHPNLEDMKEEDFDRILGVNLKGSFFATRAAAPLLAADGGGDVVMTSSIAGVVGIGSSIAYCASKAGVNNLCLTLGRALGPKNIRVNAVAPGFIDGEWLQQGFGENYEKVKAHYESRAPLGRVCTAEEVAQAIVGLVEGSDLVTGQVLPIEGGALLFG